MAPRLRISRCRVALIRPAEQQVSNSPTESSSSQLPTLELHRHIGFGTDQYRNLMLATEGHGRVPPELSIQQEPRHGDARREAILNNVDHFLRGGAVRITGRLKGLRNLEALQQRNWIFTEPDQGSGSELMAEAGLCLTAVVVIDAFHRPSGVGHMTKSMARNAPEGAFLARCWRSSVDAKESRAISWEMALLRRLL
ncbi:hypothetical protein ACMT4L_03210 [Deinococcus sp. A31D244]|uniref:hypothetical protein n=1 Tax=Deinococcus sp. A31D244 TaxID=3397675 RepID=UPI0039DFD272